MKALRVTSGVALGLTFGLIVLGAWVRATGSGLSCPDWPTCYGHLVPLPSDIPESAGYTYFQVMLEWLHRLVAGVILGPLILVIGFLCWRLRDQAAGLAGTGGLLVLLLLVQASLGGVTVLDQNSPWSVALHLGTALLLFSVLWLIFVRAAAVPTTGAEVAAARWLAVLTFGLAFAAMVSAALMTKSGASLACASWPLCNDGLIPDLDDPGTALNVLHRTLAALFLAGAVALWLALRRTALGPAASLMLGLAALEVLLGGLIVALRIPVWSGVAHQALGVATFAVVNYLMWRSVVARGLEQAHQRDWRSIGERSASGTPAR
ncbi:MAG: COX15/CtaA family protein [Geminicoccaceae bacterium]|nr:COX15/CtaA family protein [Geminicoccaceae bacterium]